MPIHKDHSKGGKAPAKATPAKATPAKGMPYKEPMHKMPGGHMMSDKDMEKMHKKSGGKGHGRTN